MNTFVVLILAAAPILDSGLVVHDLKVRQQNQSGGTQHFAGPTVLSIERKSARLADEFSPLVDAQLPIGKRAWLVLGWSSGGAGMMSIELLVVCERDQLTIVDRLTWVTARALSGVFLRKTATGWQIGLPELEPLVDFYDQTLIHGKRRANVGRELSRLLRFERPENDESTWAYHPPHYDAQTSSRRVAWVDATERGFNLPSE